MTDIEPGRLTIDIEAGDTPVFTSENWPNEPVWVLAIDQSGTSVSAFAQPQSYDWALAALRRLEETFMHAAGYFSREDFGLKEEDDNA